MSPKDLIHLAADDGLAIPMMEEDAATDQPLLLDKIAPDSDTIAQNPPSQPLPSLAPSQSETLSTPPSDAVCLALMGAAGGVGVTSLAIEIAYNLARKAQRENPNNTRAREPRVCLIDLDFENGACAPHLDLLPSLTMEDLQGAPARIDRAFTSALMSTHKSGLALLAAPHTLGGNDKVNPQTIVTLLDMACQMYDFVVLDVPRFWRPWTMAAIGGADHFALVSDLTIPSLHLARARLEAVESTFEGAVKCDVILNKHERRSFRNALRIKDAEMALKRDVFASICFDIDTARESINCGEPAGAIRPDSRFSKDIRELQTAWIKPAPEAAQKKKSAA